MAILCQKVGHVWEKRTCGRPVLLYKFLNASSVTCAFAVCFPQTKVSWKKRVVT